MTNEPPTNNSEAPEGWEAYNVIAVSFDDDANAYNALTVLKELDSQRRVGVQHAVVVIRDEDGQLIEKDAIESMFLQSTAGGTLVGLLIGIIGGPLGVLIGGTTGLLVGSMFDLYDIDETESALGAISGSLKVGRTGLLAVVTEQSPEVIDVAMSNVGGTVLRRSVDDVEAEIAAAESAQRQAQHEARKELLRSRREQNKAAVNAKLEELKAKVHHGEKSATAAKDTTAAPAGG